MSGINDSNAVDWNGVTSRFYDNRPLPKAECTLPADHHEVMKGEHYDPVNQPQHYKVGEVEAIDYIAQQLGIGVQDYLLGNVHKYLHRHRFKGQALEDLRKCRWYLDRLLNEVEQGG